MWGFDGRDHSSDRDEGTKPLQRLGNSSGQPFHFGGENRRRSSSSMTKQGSLSGFLMTLEQACLAEYHEAQCAFKDSMIH
jgi:hypothetical protein